MARTIFTGTYSDFQQANAQIQQILSSHNYSQIDENGELVWKCGVGFWTAMKYVKIEFGENNTMRISGWIRPVFGSEQDLKGVVGALPKKQVLNVIQELQNAIV